MSKVSLPSFVMLPKYLKLLLSNEFVVRLNRVVF